VSPKTNPGEKSSKKEQILQAAVEMFLEREFYVVKMEEIAEHANVGKGTLYEYFSNKEDLFKESISYWMEKYLQNFNESLKAARNARETLYHIMKVNLEFLQENSPWIGLLYNERPSNMYEMSNWFIERRQHLLQGISGIIQSGIQEGDIRPDLDIEMASRMFLALNYVVMGGMIILDGKKPGEEELESVMELFWKGVGSYE